MKSQSREERVKGVFSLQCLSAREEGVKLYLSFIQQINASYVAGVILILCSSASILGKLLFQFLYLNSAIDRELTHSIFNSINCGLFSPKAEYICVCLLSLITCCDRDLSIGIRAGEQ